MPLIYLSPNFQSTIPPLMDLVHQIPNEFLKWKLESIQPPTLSPRALFHYQLLLFFHKNEEKDFIFLHYYASIQMIFCCGFCWFFVPSIGQMPNVKRLMTIQQLRSFFMNPFFIYYPRLHDCFYLRPLKSNCG